jgi:hypothetical protein
MWMPGDRPNDLARCSVSWVGFVLGRGRRQHFPGYESRFPYRAPGPCRGAARVPTTPRAGGSATVNVSCPPQTKILGGGAHFDNYSGTISWSSMNFNRDPITWKAAGTNHGSSAQSLHALVICEAVG